MVLSCFFVAFFWPALARYSEVYFSPADVSQTHSLTRVEAAHIPGNELLSDLAVQMEPWLEFNKRELSAGRIPLWNPYNGGGTPHLANGQAAVFSPFSLPYYLLSFRAALIVSAALKLLALGLFTHLFLRRLGLFLFPSLLGAVAFAFAGHNVLLLGYPHPAAAAALPAGLYFVERTFQRFEVTGRHSPGSLVGLCLSMAVGLIAGQPEPGFFAIGLIGLYTLVRAVHAWRGKGGSLRTALTLSPCLLQVFVAAALAACMGAFKILPFLEYLRDSRLLEQRSDVQTPLIAATWPLEFFPNLLGNPSQDYYLAPTIPPPNFETATLAYAGGLVLFLALISLAFVRKHRAHAFFAIVAVLWIFYAYDIGGTWRIFAAIPGLDLAPINRSQPVWLFAIACCAAFAVQRMLEAERRRFTAALAIVASAGALLFFFRQATGGLVEQAVEYVAKLKDPPKIVAADIRLFAAAHVAEMSTLFVVGCLAVAAGWLAPRGPVRQALAAGILVMVYLGSGNLFKQYNPVCENRFFYPETSAIAALKEKVGDERLVILGEDTLVPDTNMMYGLSLISNYDGLWLRRYDRLYREIFGESNNWRHAMRGSGKGLKLFGADWVLSPDEWIGIDTAFGEAHANEMNLFSAGEVVPGARFRQGFTPTRNHLQALCIFATAGDCSADNLLQWYVADSKSGELLVNGTIEGGELHLSPAEPRAVILRFDEPLNRRGRALTLCIRAPTAVPGHSVSLWARRDGSPLVNEMLWREMKRRQLDTAPSACAPPQHVDLESWSGMRGDEVVDGGLWIDLSYALGDFEYSESLKPFDLFRYKRGLGRWHLVSQAASARTEEDSFARTLHPAIDPAITVVLEGVDCPVEKKAARPADEKTLIEVLEDLPGSQRLRFTRQQPGWLVLTQPWYPGWKARVNGSQRAILHANYAFGAVKVDAGESVVELVFEPQSFKFGVWISFSSALVMALLTFYLARKDSAAVNGLPSPA